MYDGTKLKSIQLQPNQATTCLGLTSQVDENQSTQTTILKKKANKISRKLNCCHMPHYYEHIHQLCSINQKLPYPLVASSMNNKQLKSIHSINHSKQRIQLQLAWRITIWQPQILWIRSSRLQSRTKTKKQSYPPIRHSKQRIQSQLAWRITMWQPQILWIRYSRLQSRINTKKEKNYSINSSFTQNIKS